MRNRGLFMTIALAAVLSTAAGCGPTIRAISGQSDEEMLALALRVAGLQQYAEKDAAFGKGMSEYVNRQGAAIKTLEADVATLKRRAGLGGGLVEAPNPQPSSTGILPPTWPADVQNLAGIVPVPAARP